MTTRLKTDISPNKSGLVEGDEMNASDFIAPVDGLRDYLREGNVAATDSDTHVKALINAIKPVAPIATKEATDGTHGKQVEVYFSGTLPPANGGAGANTSAMSGLAKLTSGVVSAAVAETDYVTPTGAGTLQNKTLDSDCSVPLAALSGSGAATGNVVKWSGSAAVWGAEGTGGALPKDLTVTAGENLAIRDYVFLNTSDNKWYKADNDDVTKIGLKRGVVTQSGGIAANASGTVRVDGEVDGFSGLTAWADVYLSSTAGGITQTKPTVSAGGGQRQLVKIGYATATTKIMVEPFHPIEFLKRESLANAAFMTITHINDPQARNRAALSYLSGTEPGATIVAYGSANQDTGVALNRLVYSADICAGGTATGSTTTAPYSADRAFDNNTADFGWIAGITTGALQYDLGVGNSAIARRYTLFCYTNAGQPARMPRDWTFQGSNDGSSWTTLDTRSGVTGWAEGETKTYSFANSTAYRYYRMNVSANNAGDFLSIDEMTVHTASANTKISQSFTLAETTEIDKVRLYLKKTGSPTGTDPVRIETESGGSASGTLAHANATATLSESGLGTSYGFADADLTSTFSLAAGTYHIVLSTDRAEHESNYIEWGADGSSPGFSGGVMKSQTASVWGDESKDAVFEVTAPGLVYDQMPSLGLWSGGANVGVQFGDGSAGNQNTTTSFKNFIGSTQDITCVVKLL